MSAHQPESGDWFALANEISGLRTPEGPQGTHPFLVISTIDVRIPILPRSTSRLEGHPHRAHRGSCGSESCRINKDGYINTDPIHVDESHLTNYSCTEPDQDFMEWAMSRTGSSRQTRRRGRK